MGVTVCTLADKVLCSSCSLYKTQSDFAYLAGEAQQMVLILPNSTNCKGITLR